MAKIVGRPVGRDSSETRERILISARQLFADRGFAQTPMTLIAEDAGVTPAAVRFHFPGRAAIFEVVYTRTIDSVVELARPRIETAPTFVAKVDALLGSLLELQKSHRHVANFTATASVEIKRHEELAHLANDRRLMDLYAEIARAAVAEGAIAATDERVVRGMLSATMFGLSQLVPSVSMPTYESYVRAFIRLYDGTLIVRPDTKRRRADFVDIEERNVAAVNDAAD